MIFQRAALREFTSTAAAVFIALFFILVTVILVRLLSQAAGGRVPPDAVLALIGFSSLNHLPVVGESFVREPWRFEVLDLDGRRIDKVLVGKIG